jgi:hypothetical protein
MLRRIFYLCACFVRAVPRACWILLLLLFQIFEVYILWPPAGAGSSAGVARPRPADAGQVQTLQSQLPPPFVKHLNEKWAGAAQHVLPDLNECRDACQCDRDKSDGKTSIAWTVNQIQHSAGTNTRVSLQWLPDGAGAAVQCIFGDRIVKGHLITADSGDTGAQKASAAAARPAAPSHFQIDTDILHIAAKVSRSSARRVALHHRADSRTVPHHVLPCSCSSLPPRAVL